MPMRLNSEKHPGLFVEYDDATLQKFVSIYGREWEQEVLILMSHELLARETGIEQPNLIDSEPMDPMASLYNVKISRF